MPIFHGLNKLSLVDYPGLMSCILFTGGCNFRCPWCQNGPLVLAPWTQPTIDNGEILAFLEKRNGMLDGVVVTGGEPTLQKDLPDFIRKIKDIGLLVKLDTNGTNPGMLRSLVEGGLVDYVAMDIKNSLPGYARTAGLDFLDTSPIEESVAFLKEGRVDWEFRTTVVRGLHYERNFHEIGAWLAPCRRYFLQSFAPSEDTISKGWEAPSREEMEAYLEILRTYIGNVEIRDSRD